MDNMYYIAVYSEDETLIGWIDSQLNLTDDRKQRSGFSSKQTADEVRLQLENDHDDWYTELE
jgi:hypothetical protein